jgi:hypothetical protein
MYVQVEVLHLSCHASTQGERTEHYQWWGHKPYHHFKNKVIVMIKQCKIRKLHECVFGVKISHECFSWPEIWSENQAFQLHRYTV